ncbi:MAG: hypothetical protein EON60_06135 [Alphaproteobacteria bacterium]|nr:MAG: hypothetical protein EON60_06135 [Alphaproteobacteria bacterium]
MTIEIAVSNPLPHRHLGPKTRNKLIAERGFTLAVDNSDLQIPLFVKVVASVIAPHYVAVLMNSKAEILLAARSVYDSLPYQLRHTDPLDGQWMPRYVGEPRTNGVQVDARIGMLPIRLTSPETVIHHIRQATLAGIAFCDAWEKYGWRATHTVRLIRHLNHIPPPWLLEECVTRRIHLCVEAGRIQTRA